MMSAPHAVPVYLAQIKERLGLSIMQMAELFGVTRKSVYDWYDGVAPQPKMVNRIEIVCEVLDTQPLHVDLCRLKASWHIPVSDKSFCAIVTEDGLSLIDFRIALTAKLHELLPRLVSSKTLPSRGAIDLGEAHTSEFGRFAELG